MRIILFITILTCSHFFTNAQSIDDALRYSNLFIQGTASGSATGNSFNALGADFTGASMNPAGLAEFRSSYFVLTPAYIRNTTESSLASYRGNSRSTDRLAINNIGLVFSSQTDDTNWSRSNLAIGINKLADFNERFYYSGKTVGSITERFIERSNGKTTDELDDFEAWPAADIGAIYNDGQGDNNYVSDIKRTEAKVQKDQFVIRSGSIKELDISWGGSYNDELNIGFGVGIPFISFEEVKEYNETDVNDEISNFGSLYYKEYLSTNGTGLNLKFGAIYKVKNIVRLGLSISSPTWIILKDEYYSDMTYKYTENNEDFEFSHESPIGKFKYKMATPWSTTASIGTLFRSGDWRGFVNLDVDIKDYTNARFNLESYSDDEADKRFEDELNREVDEQLGMGITYRLGGEIAYKKARLRLGYSAIGSPYSIDGLSKNQNVYSIGTGFRWSNVSLDFSYMISQKEEGYIPYLLLSESRNQLVQNTTDLRQTAITLGFSF